MAVPESIGEVAGCGCPAGTEPVLGFNPPAPLALEHGPFALCAAHTPRPASLCDDGRVIHRFQGDLASGAGVDFGYDDYLCMDPLLCLFAERQLPVELQGGCIYPDYTAAETGMIDRVGDCAALGASGLCALDCPCPERRLPHCWGISESQPIGVCTEDPCGTGRSCEAGNLCAQVADPPDFANEIQNAPFAGRCTPEAACRALVARTGEVWACPARPL